MYDQRWTQNSCQPQDQLERGRVLFVQKICEQCEASEDQGNYYYSRFKVDDEPPPNPDDFVDEDSDIQYAQCMSQWALRKFIVQSLEKPVPLEKTMRMMWQWFVDSLEHLRKTYSGELIATAWKTLSAIEKDHFLLTFDISDEGITLWERKVMNQRLLDLALNSNGDQTAQSGSDEINDPHIPYVYRGRLEAEVYYFCHLAYFIICTATDDVKAAAWEESHANRGLWAVAVTSDGRLEDDECSICYESFQVPPVDADPSSSNFKNQPLRLIICDHVLCYSCFEKWTTSHAENFNCCPSCREVMPRPTPTFLAWIEIQKAVKSAAGFRDGPQTYIEGILKNLDVLFNELYGSLREEPDLPTLAALRVNLESPDDTETWIDNTGLVSHSGRKLHRFTEHETRLALKCLRLSRDKIRAFLSGDSEQYRKFSRSLLQARI